MGDGYLTTHVLDTARGVPAAGIEIALYRNGADIARAVTNAEGRTDTPILPKGQMTVGEYELLFLCGPYLRAHGAEGQLFLDEVPIRFGIADAEAHYHVPLLLSPYGYSTYRGS
ncbi:MAG: hydroxyisourate hydrolase [Pseudomonadota bacterium]